MIPFILFELVVGAVRLVALLLFFEAFFALPGGLTANIYDVAQPISTTTQVAQEFLAQHVTASPQMLTIFCSYLFVGVLSLFASFGLLLSPGFRNSFSAHDGWALVALSRLALAAALLSLFLWPLLSVAYLSLLVDPGFEEAAQSKRSWRSTYTLLLMPELAAATQLLFVLFLLNVA